MSAEIIRVSDERWKNVPGFDGEYKISDLGRIKSIKPNRKIEENIMSPSTTKNGYRRVKLTKHGKCVCKSIHRIVLETFLPNDDNVLIVNHKNGIRNDNRLSNLEWVTHSENVKHSFDVLGRKMTFMKPVHQLTKTGELVKCWDSITDASKSLGLSHSTISQCCNGVKVRKTCGGFKWKFVNK